MSFSSFVAKQKAHRSVIVIAVGNVLEPSDRLKERIWESD